jgi:hypothetical protein
MEKQRNQWRNMVGKQTENKTNKHLKKRLKKIPGSGIVEFQS